MKLFCKIIRSTGVLIMIFLSFLIAIKSFGYLDFKVKKILVGREELLKTWLYPIAFYLHVFFGSIALIIGPFQFIKKFRSKFVAMHKLIGRIYVISCLAASISGLYVALYANGGWVARLGFIIADILWFSTTVIGYLKIKNGQFISHGNWLRRSYALTFAAVTLRVWIGVLLGSFRFDYETAYQIVAWWSWIPNLLLIEMAIFRFVKIS